MLLIGKPARIFAAFLFTVKSRNGPVASDGVGVRRQLEDERPDVGVGVGVCSGDVDPGVGTRAVAHLSLTGDQHRRVVVDVDQVDLERPRSARWRRPWRRKMEDQGQSRRRRDGG